MIFMFLKNNTPASICITSKDKIDKSLHFTSRIKRKIASSGLLFCHP